MKKCERRKKDIRAEGFWNSLGAMLIALNPMLAGLLARLEGEPDGTVSILPVKLDECEVPPRLRRWQYAELFREDGYRQLLAGLRKQGTLLREVYPPDPLRTGAA